MVNRRAEQGYDVSPSERELVGLGVDLIIVNPGVTAPLAAKQANCPCCVFFPLNFQWLSNLMTPSSPAM